MATFLILNTILFWKRRNLPSSAATSFASDEQLIARVERHFMQEAEGEETNNVDRGEAAAAEDGEEEEGDDEQG